MATITHRLRCEMLESRRLAADLSESLGVSVESFDIEGLRAAEIRVKYDPQSLDLSNDSIQPGEAWRGRASVISHVDQEAGAVSIFLFATEPIETKQGKLVDLQFAAVDNAIIDVSSASVSEVRLNEGAIESSTLLTSNDESSVKNVEPVKACQPWAE